LVAFGVYYVKVVEDIPTHSAIEMYSEESSAKRFSLLTIFAGNHPQRGR